MYKGLNVLVLGLGKSGKAAVRLLSHFGAHITINDGAPKENIPEYDEYIKQGFEVICGSQPKELFERDFDLCVKAPGINYHADFILRLKERNIPVITEIELAYRVCKKQNYIAVTGTNGKTTTVSLMYHVLKKYRNAHICGNYGIPYCDVVMDEKLYENENHDIVLEMSNFQLIDIDTFKPQISTVLNLTPDHLDYMDSLDEYYASKMRIYKNCDENDVYLLNKDDKTLLSYIEKYRPLNKIETFSVKEDADCYLKDNCIYYKGEKVIARDDLKIVGIHNVSNVMVSILALIHMGLSIKEISDEIKTFIGVEHRLEYVDEINGVKYFNDSKGTNTDAAIIAINAFEKPVILLMGGFEKGLDVKCVAALNHKIKTLITFGAAGERFNKDMNHPNSINVKTMKEATMKAFEIAKDGDIVLLSPSTSSFDEFKNMGERGRVFKDIVKSFK